jgi:hypothetical protein
MNTNILSMTIIVEILREKYIFPNRQIFESRSSALSKRRWTFVKTELHGNSTLDTIFNIQHSMRPNRMLTARHSTVSYLSIYFLIFHVLFLGVQRGHQNTLENYPQFLLMLGLGAIRYPLISSIGGAIWLIGRLAYFHVSRSHWFMFCECSIFHSVLQRVIQLVNQRNDNTAHLATSDYSPWWAVLSRAPTTLSLPNYQILFRLNEQNVLNSDSIYFHLVLERKRALKTEFFSLSSASLFLFLSLSLLLSLIDSLFILTSSFSKTESNN